MERFSFVFLVAGLGFFALAFVVSAWVPMLEFGELSVESIEELAADPPQSFLDLKDQYPVAYKKAFGDQDDSAAFADALRTGRKIYIGEGCWHCHSQQVRPVGSDEERFGRLSYPEEYNNEMNYPPIWGTRRIGPDLIREADKHSNDWHVAHFWHPPDVAPTSVMPSYRWFFERDDPDTEVDESLTPNRKGLSIIAYVQWLGSWQDNRRETIHAAGSIDRAFDPPVEHKEEPPKKDDNEPKKDDDGFGDGGDDPFGDDGKTDEPDPFE